MTDPKPPAPPSIRSIPPPPKTKSGEMPAVKKYREKLDSISGGVALELDQINRLLKDYIDTESDRPPPLVEEAAEGPPTPRAPALPKP